MYSSPPQEQSSQALLTSCESAPLPQARALTSASADGPAELPTIEGTRKNSRWTEQQITDALSSLWKENLEQIKIAHNAEAWQRIKGDVIKQGHFDRLPAKRTTHIFHG